MAPHRENTSGKLNQIQNRKLAGMDKEILLSKCLGIVCVTFQNSLSHMVTMLVTIADLPQKPSRGIALSHQLKELPTDILYSSLLKRKTRPEGYDLTYLYFVPTVTNRTRQHKEQSKQMPQLTCNIYKH